MYIKVIKIFKICGWSDNSFGMASNHTSVHCLAYVLFLAWPWPVIIYLIVYDAGFGCTYFKICTSCGGICSLHGLDGFVKIDLHLCNRSMLITKFK